MATGSAFNKEDKKDILLVRRSQGFYESVQALKSSVQSIEIAIAHCSDKDPLYLRMHDEMDIVSVFDALINNLLQKQRTFEERYEDIVELHSSNVESTAAWKILSDEGTSLGQRLSVIKKYCRSEYRRLIFFRMAFNFHLGVGKVLTQLRNVRDAIKESRLCQFTLLEFTELQADRYSHLLVDLENILIELLPISDNFKLNASKFVTAVEDILSN
jgi:hypothetical protein